MGRIAKVIPEVGPDQQYDYLIPDELSEKIELGSRVKIPFGHSEIYGYVVGWTERSDRRDLKEIRAVIGARPLISGSLMALARWMAEYYCVSLVHAVRTAVPALIRNHRAHFLQRLFVKPVEIFCPRVSQKQERVLKLLRERNGMFFAELAAEAGVSQSVIRSLERRGLVAVELAPVRRTPFGRRHILRTDPLPLMPSQAEALEAIKACADNMAARRADGKKGTPGVVLLFGITGSGKTEVYLQAIDYVLSQGRGAIVLVPEIALTPQTQERFAARFGVRLAVLHSHMSDGERHDEWHRIREGEADIVIGARSAVFAPVQNLGLIVVDEEHEPSYKQEEPPRYSARDVAVMRGHIEGCGVVLGSATPSLESWFNARCGKYHLVALRERADNRKLPHVRVVDMRMETQRTGRPGVLSSVLLDAMRLRLDRGEQTILFLNRRGFATSLSCPHCGYVANCNQCSVAYTYHRSDDRLHCHMCGAGRKAPTQCPQCGNPAFRFAGVGTQRVESIVTKCFPTARIQRIDADVTTRKGSYERILGDFRSGKTDILIGTQMIAKGLHFPNVTLVGVIYADLSLHMPDFRAGERTFQLLAQVAGRAGRGEVPGEVIVQTYTPFHVAVQTARRQDYEAFCDQELEFRRELQYPPFTHLTCILLKGRFEEKVSLCAAALARRLRVAIGPDVILADASPAPLLKAKGLYRYQIIMRSRSPRAMVAPIRSVLREFKPPPGVTITVDVDAVNLV